MNNTILLNQSLSIATRCVRFDMCIISASIMNTQGLKLFTQEYTSLTLKS